MKNKEIVLKSFKENRIYKVINSIVEEKGLNFSENTIQSITEQTIFAVECQDWDVVDAIHHYIYIEFYKNTNQNKIEEEDDIDLDIEII